MAVVLLSGGLDSAFNLASAAKQGKAQLALTMHYGQRAAAKELTAARALAEFYRVPWQSVDLPWLGEVSGSALNRVEKQIPQPEISQLDDLNTVLPSMRSVWVPNRNGVLLNAAAAIAEARGFDTVYVGFNREEAVTFPDNSEAYLEALTESLRFSTLNAVKAASFSLHMDKAEILRAALALELPLELVWSCYESQSERCGKCESCKRTIRGLVANGELGKAWIERLFRTEL